jgi:hypothetical protein
MDAFSRLLASIGQSLGKGLGQVGQSELEQRQRLEALEAQRKASVSGQLLQTFTQLLNTQGIQEVDPEGIRAIQQAVTDLALGKIDSPNVQTAISIFPKVADSANKIAVYRELATKDLDALSRLIVNTNPDEAQKLLNAVGLRGMYEGLRSRGEILTQADQLGLQLTKEQIENLTAQRKALLAELEPKIRLLEAQGQLTAAQAQDILQKLPLALTKLQLEAQNLAIQAKKGEIELDRLDEILDAQIKKDLAAVGVSEAQAAVLREQIPLIREQVKTEVLRQAQIEAETERTKAQTELTKAQAQQITATLEPTIRSILADISLKEAQKGEIEARTNAILQRLPVELEDLLLGIKKKQIELDKLPNLLDAELAERFAKIGLTEAQTGLTKTNIDFIKEQTKSEILRQLQTEAETERTRAQTELIKKQSDLVAEQVLTEAQNRKIALSKAALEWFKDITGQAIALSLDTPEKVKELLKGFGDFYNLPNDFIDFAANQIATTVKEVKADKDLQRTGAIADAIAKVMNTALAAESPEVARKVANAMLPPSVSKELRASIGNMAYYLKTLRLGSDTAAIIEPYMKMLPQTPEDESRLLRELYDSFLRAKGDTPENRRIANGIVNTIKGQWALTKAMQALEKEGKKAGIDKDLALTALYKVNAALARQQFALEEQKLALEREQFIFEKWYKGEQVKLGWARLELDKLIAQAQAAGTGQDTVKALKDLASAAKTLDDVAVRQLANALRASGHASCADSLGKSGTINWLEAVRGTDTECDKAIYNILNNREQYGDVINVVENAVGFGQMVTEMATRLVGGKPAQPGGTTQPGITTAPGGAPSGTATPQLQGGATGLQKKAAKLKQFGVPVPNDPKVAGAMTFIYALENGPPENPFQIIPASGVAPTGQDRGFSAAVEAEPIRQKAIEIDSAPALGASWFLPVIARTPSVKVRYLDPKIVEAEANKRLFERAKYFGDDGIAVAAAYTAGALERSGFPVKYTPLFTALMRTVAENDLAILAMPKPMSQAEAERRFLNLVKSRYGSKYKELGLSSLQELLDTARQLYQATRLSNIGKLALGGGR